MTAFTKHARVRIRQRGLREGDVEFILNHGTDTGDGAILADKDARRVIAEAKKQIDMAERLRNKRVVADGDEIITVFHADSHQAHELLHP
jgi:hypothetical protein